MENIVLKAEIVDKIRANDELRISVAKALGVRLSSLPRILKASDPRLTQANVLMLLSKELSVANTSEFLDVQDVATGA